MFITLDGIDGVGKSTQIKRLLGYFEAIGEETLLVRDPGTTRIGGKLRELLLESDLELHRRTEAMLFMASRCEMVETILLPAIADGKTVISTGFFSPTWCIRASAALFNGSSVEDGRLANGGLIPDLTTCLLASPAIDGAPGNEKDRMESRVDYMEEVRQAFLQQLPNSSDNTLVINADQSPEDVSREMLAKVKEILDERRA